MQVNSRSLYLLAGALPHENAVKKGNRVLGFYWAIAVNWLKAWKSRIPKRALLLFRDSSDVYRIFLPLWHIWDARHINNEKGFRSESLCIIDAIICWFSWAENCWKIILFVPLSVVSAESYRKSALPESYNHYKVNFVPDSMEVIGRKYLIDMMRIILS